MSCEDSSIQLIFLQIVPILSNPFPIDVSHFVTEIEIVMNELRRFKHSAYFLQIVPILLNPSPINVSHFVTVIEIVMNELQRFKHSADFFANSSHILESAAISAP